MPTPNLSTTCATVHSLYPRNCSGAVKHFAKQFGHILPDVQANGLIDFFDNGANGWQVVNETAAQNAADGGNLVIAGKKDSPDGHVVVVMPGGKAPSGGYSYTDKHGKQQTMRNHGSFPRSCSTSLGHWPGATSKGEKTVFDAWGDDAKYQGVKYWLAPAPVLALQNLKSGMAVKVRVAIPAGKVWDFPALNTAKVALPAGTAFGVGGVNTAEKWVDMEARSPAGIKLRLSAREVAALLEPV